ncbi:serine hydrolase domain-containing protein [Salinibacter sp.]|uniref:serine hydrolase domain-containing protein n=1 Tax=Salinibacter sp. TaxID=2065818 RepID=UPI0021E8BBC6|nr:serine hydrolase domain-containing protein [Salinibacter sp.]
MPDAATGQASGHPKLRAVLDSAASAHVASSRVAGASVAVVQGSDTLLHEGYGQADLEHGVPMPGDAVFEIGSITKQFTAAAVLQLAAKDSLGLDAPIIRYLPSFDMGGHTITVRHLLHHTSGIPDWSSFPEAETLRPQDLPRDTVLALLEDKMMRFAPGTAMSYSNSGYFLLGRIIEEASGQSYAEYVEKHLFQPAGMGNSYYCNERAVVENKAHGYAWRGKKGFKHKKYVDHRWPYAAGSLCSTAGDMVAWTQALHGGDVLPDSMYREMTTPGRLDDGTELRYGMGLVVSDVSGRRVMRHGGEIFGFLSEARYYPRENLTLVVLQNTAGPKGPLFLADQLADLTLGPGEEPKTRPYEGNLSTFTGRYSGPARGGLMTLQVKVADGKLVVTEAAGGAGPMPLEHTTRRTWRRGSLRYRFVQVGGEIIELRVDGGGAHYVLRKIGVSENQ